MSAPPRRAAAVRRPGAGSARSAFDQACRLLDRSLAARLATARVDRRYARVSSAPSVPSLRFDGLIQDIERKRLALFRLHAGTTVDSATGLFQRLRLPDGLDLDRAALALRPAGRWPEWLAPRAPFKGARWSACAFVLGLEPRPPRWFRGGVVLRERATGGGGTIGMGLLVTEGSLELGLDLGRAWIRTHGRFGAVVMDGALPGTVSAALPGGTLDELIDHPLVDLSGLRIVSAADGERGAVVRFRCPQMPWSMPWARGGATAALGAGAWR